MMFSNSTRAFKFYELHRLRFLLIGLVLFGYCLTLSAQLDSLVFHNGDHIIGEVKNMDRGVLLVETDYSKSDFKIEWKEVKEIYSKTRFLISLQRGGRFYGVLESMPGDSVSIISEDGVKMEMPTHEIVFLSGLKSKFWDRVTANVDIGLNVTKANDLRQLNVQAAVGYLADKWSSDLYYNDFFSTQDSISATRRKDGGLNYRFYLPRDWYAFPAITYLSNTEQALKGRLTTKVGFGKFIEHTNTAYWGVSGGASLLKETFTNDTDEKNSAELFVSTELNLFDIGDLSLLTNVYFYKSLTEKNRLRSDFKIDTKYEFLSDFYVKFSLTLNYDNQPAVVGKETDYVYGISFGWELD